MAGIFVNYRGRDSAWAVLLDRELTERFGQEKVFRASRSIRAGDDFVSRILDAVRSSSVLLAVIGPDWATGTGSAGRCRLQEPGDWVRREIAEAFVAGIPVVPVLTGAACSPAAADLPADIVRLARCQYLRLHHRSVAEDIDRITRELSELDPALGGPKPPPAARLGRTAGQPRHRAGRTRLVAAAVAAAVMAGLAYLAVPAQRFTGASAANVTATGVSATIEQPADTAVVEGNAVHLSGVLSGPLPAGHVLWCFVHDERDRYTPTLAQVDGNRWQADVRIGPVAKLTRIMPFELIVTVADERGRAAIAQWRHAVNANDGMSRLPAGITALASRNVRRIR